MAATNRSTYEAMRRVIREELAPIALRLDKLETALETKYYTRESVDLKLEEVKTRHDNLAVEVQRQAQGWQAATVRYASYASILYVVYQLLHTLHAF